MVRFHAGLHLVTLDERSGDVMRSQTFLTWQPETSRQVRHALRDAGEGRLLLLVGLVSPQDYGEGGGGSGVGGGGESSDQMVC